MNRAKGDTPWGSWTCPFVPRKITTLPSNGVSGTQLAWNRDHDNGLSLSPSSLQTLSSGDFAVLPSPNGSLLSYEAKALPCYAGSLRNAAAVARSAGRRYGKVAVIAAGERWASDSSLRPCVEDLIGAGAIVHSLHGSKSPEAKMAEAAFLQFADNLCATLLACSSGVELVGRGFAMDVEIASALNVSKVSPVLVNGIFVPTE